MGIDTESNSISHEKLKGEFGSDYCRIKPAIHPSQIGKPSDANPQLLLNYVNAAQEALKGNEAFIRRLVENRRAKNSST